jgi:type I restriction enzyme, R subunit
LPPMKRTMRSVELLLAPEQILEILRDFTLYTSLAVGSQTIPIKVIPRYPQVEGVHAIVARAMDAAKRQGLIWHHQGSGKTFLMAFAAVKLLREPNLDAPTVLVVLDRLDLIEQTSREFLSAGVPRVRTAETKEELRRLLSEDARGVIITTIFRFEAAGQLNERSNIIVLADEAHRTQEGRLGQDMRTALPHAQFFGLTGTPISDADRNTFALFGDPGDPGHVMNSYSVERSIADGATLPVHVETRLVNFHIDKDGLDQAYAEMADEEGLTDEERDVLARRASRVDTFMRNPERIRAVCEDIVDHWYAKLAPLGLKAQVVAFDREMCIAYLDEIKRLLTERAGLEPGSQPFEASVVMTVGSVKGEPDAWQQYGLTRDQEAKLKARFRDVHDPLAFLVVTAKLLTGFDAPIEGVMYLDKPLRAHTLFQAITRTNRRWTNPITSQEKRYGLIVDYVGIGAEIARSLQTGDPDRQGQRPVDVDELFAELEASLAEAQRPFEGLDRSVSAFEVLLEAQQRIHGPGPSAAFAESFLRCEALWEFLWPDVALQGLRG